MRKFCISCVGCLPHCCSARTASQIFRWGEGSNVAFVATFMAFKLPKSAKQRICLGWIKLAYTRLHKKRNMSHIQFTLIESTACRIFITLWKLFKSLIIYCPEICPFLIAQIWRIFNMILMKLFLTYVQPPNVGMGEYRRTLLDATSFESTILLF